MYFLLVLNSTFEQLSREPTAVGNAAATDDDQPATLIPAYIGYIQAIHFTSSVLFHVII
jgi:hypothetical protein